MDALALMLTKVGVRSHSKILVVEDGVGILTTAVAERLGGACGRAVCRSARESHSWHSHCTQAMGESSTCFRAPSPSLSCCGGSAAALRPTPLMARPHWSRLSLAYQSQASQSSRHNRSALAFQRTLLSALPTISDARSLSQASSPRDAGDTDTADADARWPVLPTADQASRWMRGGCDG